MTRPSIERKVREVRPLLPARDLTTQCPRPTSLDAAMNKIAVEYADALVLLGRL